MVKYCSSFGCQNVWYPNSGISFHGFPLKRPDVLAKWIHAMKRKNFKPTKSSYLCSEHFTPESYLDTTCEKRVLKKDALPSIFNFPIHLQPQMKKPRRELIRHVPTLEESPTLDPVAPNGPQYCEVGTQTACNNHETVVYLKKKVKTLKQKVKRKNIKIRKIIDLVRYLKSIKTMSDELQECLENMTAFEKELMTSLSKKNGKKCKIEYSDVVKQFALTLYVYSPKGYKFSRRHLMLPHPSTLRSWLSKSSCNVGFINEIFEYLKIESLNKPYLKNVALVFDSMAIRKQIVYDKVSDKQWGYVDLGGITPPDQEELATEALVFQIVSYTYNFKVPIAYFFINKIPAALQSQLIDSAIRKLFEVGVVVHSITCDGALANLKLLNNLGCDITNRRMKNYFKHPNIDSNVYAILDPSHMIKLCRNTFADFVLSSDMGLISFDFIKKLHNVQEAEDLKLANALSPLHINYKNKKMNVRLAAQTISSGVADAIDFLRCSGDKDFINSEATVEFIRFIDRVFDLMNSRLPFAKGFKAPLSLSNKDWWNGVFVDTERYIKSLKINNINILEHPRKTFALGLICNMFSFKQLALDLLIQHDMKYFLTYKCSQDHLELYFSCIRSCGGWNNNPSSIQFKWTLRKLLYKNNVMPSEQGNCLNTLALEDGVPCTSIFSLEARSTCNMETRQDNNDDEMYSNLINIIEASVFSFFQNNALQYIAGYIVRKIIMRLQCEHCINLLQTVCIENDHNYILDLGYNSFTKFVSRGKLVIPSSPVIDIIKYTEKAIRAELNVKIKKNLKSIVRVLTARKFGSSVCNLFPNHPTIDFTSENLHESQLLNTIVSSYYDLRMQTYCKKKTLRTLGERASIRHCLNKTILFNNV